MTDNSNESMKLGRLTYSKWWVRNLNPRLTQWIDARATDWVDPDDFKIRPEMQAGRWYPARLDDVTDEEILSFIGNLIDLMENRWHKPEYVLEFIEVVYDLVAAKKGARNYPRCCLREILGLPLPDLTYYQLDARNYIGCDGKCQLSLGAKHRAGRHYGSKDGCELCKRESSTNSHSPAIPTFKSLGGE